ncbi:hypothetical protein GCM10007205_23700 [Oxalicibacterium flavum]|uniref:Autotransporter domain-containing protein n=1 Tax=Oxalicibacterium flavum TaxID=179467 RepID=A0A8J2UNM5_9BURK|nr:autotransporter outer membrane beta-barrel domain-containing protein [Oxalicibacterium flavum]GGC14127.1 hypothetical protein GCM10007205_23700 [Oxalicibacterium flavum]
MLLAGSPSHAQTLGIAYGGGGASGSPGNGVAAGGIGGNAGVSGPTAGSDSRSGNGGGNGGTALSGSPVSGANGGNAYDGSGMEDADGAGGGAGGFGIVLSNASGNLNSNATITGGTGGVGGWGSYGGGGGGGGGSALYVETNSTGTSLTVNAAITGGAGGVGGTSGGGGYNTTSGAGGNSSGSGGSGAVGNNGSGGGSGGGGGGGVQFVSTASGTTTITNNGSVTGGNGGNGGRDGGGNGRGGNAGNGGNGIALSGSQIQLTNAGSIAGGNGGQPGPCDTFCTGGAGSGGVGGVGLVVSGGGNTIVNSGSISGGLAANGTTRANAMTLSGGGNTLELQAGYTFNGNVVSSSGTTNGGDTLVLGGSANTSFDLSQIGLQYQGFNNFQKAGSSTWIVTDSTATAWQITGGTLQIGNGGTSGAISGNIINDASLVFNRSNALTYSGVLSGSGNLIKQGAGILTLSGVNIYTGDTNVSSGILRAGSANAFGDGSATTVASGATLDLNNFNQTLGSLAGSGNLSLGSALLTVGNNASTTFSGIISGTGGLNKQGSGTLTLSGANTYSGSTTVSGGTLQAGAANVFDNDSSATVNAGATLDLNNFNQTLASLAGSGNLKLGAALLTVGNNADTTFSGIISGTGSLDKQGSGTLTLSGANTHSGSTTVSGGTLQAGAANVFGDSSATVNAGATLDLNNFDQTLASLAGSGNVILGSAQLATGNNTSTNFSGSIAGTGGLTKTGSGVLTLSGANTYGGDTIISNSTLQIGDGGTTGSVTGNIVNDAALVFNRSDDLAYGGDISGAGSLAQNGTGRLVLTGTHSYTGNTVVSAGTLSVNGSIVSATRILNGGMLGGTGTTGNVHVESGGTLAPGNSIGTLTIDGNLSFAPGSIYRVEADAAGNSDRVNVSGTALLNGSVMALPASGDYATNTRYTILNAGGGFNGTSFSDVSSDLAFLTPDLSYDANNVYLRLRRNDIAYASMASTRNQVATADALQQASLDPSGDMGAALNAVNNLSAAQAPAAYDRIGGAGLVALRRAGSSFAAGLGNQIQARLNAVGTVASAQSINGMQLAANDRVADLLPTLAQADTEKFTLAGGIPAENTQHGFWLRGYGTHQETDSDGNAASTRLKEAGISVGVDARVRDDLVIGAAFSHGDADVRATFEETGKSRGNAVAVYASYASGPWNIAGHLTLARHANNMQRRIQIGTLDRNASARFDSKTIAAYGEASYDVRQDGWKLQPLAGLALMHGKTDGFTETGADALNLQVDAQSTTSIRTLIGAKALFELKNGISLQPRAIWAHEFGDVNKGMTAQLQGAPTIAFTTYGVDLPRDALIAGLTVAGKPGERLSLFADVQGEFNARQTNLGLLLGLRASW